jgi:hypothetical protein
MDHVDFIGIAGLIVALIALLVAWYGIRDVREQVHFLVKLERNLAFSKVVHKMVWRFVEPTKDTSDARTAMAEMHQFTMLAQLAEPDKTLDAVQDFASKEVLALAEEFVSNGRATWKPDMDEDVIREMVKSWQGEKNSKLVKSMFGKEDKSIL